MLWFIQHYLWDLSNAPDIRANEVAAYEDGYRVVNQDLANAVLEEIEGSEAVVMLHDYHLYLAPRFIRGAAARRLPSSLHPHPLDPAGRLAGAADPDAGGALPRDPLQRHRLLPHARVYAQLPALLPRALRLRRRRGGRDRADRRSRGLGPRLSAADLGRDLPEDRAARRGARVRAGDHQAPARAPDPARRPRRPLEERAPRLHRLRPLPRSAPGVPREGHLHRPSRALAPGRARVRRVPGAHRGAGRRWSTTATAPRTGCRST